MSARVKIRAILAAVALLATAPAQAADVKALPGPKTQQVWYVSDHTLPMIAMSAAIPAGSAYDPRGKEGLAAFAGYMLDEGAGRLNSDAFHTALANRAIKLSVTPERDYLIVNLVTLTENAKDAFSLLGLALAHPRFDADAINRVRTQIISAIAQDEEDPPTVATRAFFNFYFRDHAYAHPVSGTEQSVATIGAGDLKSFAATHWVSGGIKIAISGDIDPTTLPQLLKSAFGALPNRSLPPPQWPGRTGLPGVQVIPMDVPQPTIVFGLPGLTRSDHDFLAGYVANYIVGGGGFASRLTNEVRVQRGLTYDISTSLETFRRAGYFIGQVATKKGSVRETLDVVRSTLKDFTENGPTEKELVDAKTYLTGSYPLAFSSNVDIADQLGSFQRSNLPIDYVAKRNALIDTVTGDDVKRVAKRIFNPAAMTVVVAGSIEGGARPQQPAQKR